MVVILTRQYDIAQAEHWKSFARLAKGIEQVLGEQELNGCIKGLGDSDHDLSAEHPENIVEEQTSLLIRN
jgi:hypothetical protein